MCEIMNVEELTGAQEKATQALEKAFKMCRKANVALVLAEETLTAYNGNVVDLDGPLSEIVTDYPYVDNMGLYIDTCGYRLDGRFALNTDYVQIKIEKRN